jgi:hypothetical protein
MEKSSAASQDKVSLQRSLRLIPENFALRDLAMKPVQSSVALVSVMTVLLLLTVSQTNAHALLRQSKE